MQERDPGAGGRPAPSLVDTIASRQQTGAVTVRPIVSRSDSRWARHGRASPLSPSFAAPGQKPSHEGAEPQPTRQSAAPAGKLTG